MSQFGERCEGQARQHHTLPQLVQTSQLGHQACLLEWWSTPCWLTHHLPCAPASPLVSGPNTLMSCRWCTSPTIYSNCTTGLDTELPGWQGLASCSTNNCVTEFSSCRYDNHHCLVLQPSQSAHLAVRVHKSGHTQLAE